MAEFACRIGSEGGISERSIVATSAERAREMLAAEGVEVFAVRRRDGLGQRLADTLWGTSRGTDGAEHGTSPTPDTSVQPATGLRLFARRGVPARDLLLLTAELGALIRAGLPLLKCIDILRQRRSGSATGGVLDRVRDRIASGLSLSGAFAQEDASACIPRLFVTSLAIGENSGNLEETLRRYAQHLERVQQLRARVRGALLYPAALFTVSLGVIGILVGFVLPRFADFYANSEAALPLPTRVLIGVGVFAQNNAALLVILLAVAAVVGFATARSSAAREFRERVGLRLPLLGGLRRLYLDVESSRTMATLLRGGAPLTEAIAVAADGTDHAIYRRRLHQVGELVTQGNSLHKSLELAGLMDSMGLEMVEVGESTGTLDEMLGHVAQSYDEVLDRRLNTAVSLLEPAVLVSMGIFVAAVLLSLYLPLFNVVQAVG